jgi:ribosomal protein S10
MGTLSKTECEVSGLVALPIKIKRFCVLRSPHVDKDSREHFEIRLYKRFIDIKTESASILDFLLKTELPLISPKAKTLLDKIKELDEKDLQTDNKLYKHFIYCDIKSRRYGANFLASCFLSDNYLLCYNLFKPNCY